MGKFTNSLIYMFKVNPVLNVLQSQSNVLTNQLHTVTQRMFAGTESRETSGMYDRGKMIKGIWVYVCRLWGNFASKWPP